MIAVTMSTRMIAVLKMEIQLPAPIWLLPYIIAAHLRWRCHLCHRVVSFSSPSRSGRHRHMRDRWDQRRGWKDRGRGCVLGLASGSDLGNAMPPGNPLLDQAVDTKA